MTFLDDILFPGSNKKRVSKMEFDKVMNKLALKGVSEAHRGRIRAIFSGYPKGITEKELDAKLTDLKSSKHGLSDTTMELLETSLREKL